MEFWDDAKLQQAWKQRQARPPGKPLGDAIDRFMRGRVIRRHKKLSRLSRAWAELLPPELSQHSCVEDLRAGRLRVLVDAAAHFYELTLLIQEGLVEELQQLCPNISVSDIKLVRGPWRQTNEEGRRLDINDSHAS